VGSLLAKGEPMMAKRIDWRAGVGHGVPRLAPALVAFAGLLPVGCGDYVSWNERWPFDGEHEHGSTPPNSGEAAPVPE